MKFHRAIFWFFLAIAIALGVMVPIVGLALIVALIYLKLVDEAVRIAQCIIEILESDRNWHQARKLRLAVNARCGHAIKARCFLETMEYIEAQKVVESKRVPLGSKPTEAAQLEVPFNESDLLELEIYYRLQTVRSGKKPARWLRRLDEPNQELLPAPA